MASTIFSYGTVIASTWLNDVNSAVYTTVPTLAPLNSPNFTNPSLNTATAISINKNSFTQPTTGCTWTLADGKTLTVSNSLTLSGTDGASLVLGAGTNSFSGTTSGTNTGDQLTFKTISVSGQSDVVADTPGDSLTLVAGTGIALTTDATADSITISSTSSPAAYVLLTQMTISAAVNNIDFLNIFTSAYDKYVIELEAIAPNIADQLYMRFAESGTLMTDARYYSNGSSSASTGAALTTNIQAYSIVTASGVNGTIEILNPRLTNGVSLRSYLVRCTYYGGSVYTVSHGGGSYSSGGAAAGLSGFRLYWLTSSAFGNGTVRVYGIKNT